ncbi:MAG: ester cyclase [Cyanobacteria bacterium RYN_339]|nr:ester cyclase [Cyanobacteria bacterium RYN_339]
MTHEQLKDLIRRYATDVWNQGDPAALGDFVTTDVVYHDAAEALPIRGIDALRAFVAGHQEQTPDLALEVQEVLADGDMGACRYVLTGRHVNPFMGVAPTGKALAVPGMNLFKVRDGKFCEIWADWNVMALMVQMGAAPAGNALGATR